MTLHPFDAALQLAPAGEHRWRGTPSAAYWNMVGPFGGTTAAVVLRAVQQHPQCLGTPLSLTVNFAGPLGAAPFEVEAVPVRTNRSTQHWAVTLTQPGEDGAPQVATTATAVTALRRDTWGACDMPMPADVPAPDTVAPVTAFSGVEWVRRYDMRLLIGALPQQWDWQGDDSLSRLWVRDAAPRPLDFCSLAAIADVFYPRVWLRRATRVPAGTVSITVYFHAAEAELAATGTGHLLAQARAQAFGRGFFDQTAQLWNQAGVLLATTHQIVYFKR